MTLIYRSYMFMSWIHLGELMFRTRDHDFLRLPAASTKLLLQVRLHEPKPALVQRAKKNQTRLGLVKTLLVICLASFVLTKAQIVLVKLIISQKLRRHF